MTKFSLRHPIRSLGRIIGGIIRPSEPQEPPREPPPYDGPGPGTPGPDIELDEPRIDIWNDITDDNASYPDDLREAPEWWDLYLDTGAWIGRSYFEINLYWRDFLRAFYLYGADPDKLLRSDFYDEADVEPSLIDWDRWREIKKT